MEGHERAARHPLDRGDPGAQTDGRSPLPIGVEGLGEGDCFAPMQEPRGAEPDGDVDRLRLGGRDLVAEPGIDLDGRGGDLVRDPGQGSHDPPECTPQVAMCAGLVGSRDWGASGVDITALTSQAGHRPVVVPQTGRLR